MATRSSQIVCRWLLLLAFAIVPAVWAGEKNDSRKVRVSVVVILASETDNKVDKKLECIAREVQKMHPELKGFRMGDLSCRSLAMGAVGRFELVEEQQTSIVVQQAADKMDRIRLKVAPPQMGEITYSTPCGKFLPIVTRYRTTGKDLLILAVRVQPCHGK